MAGIEGLDRDECVHMWGCGGADKMSKCVCVCACVCVCVSYNSIVLLTAGHADSFST